MSDPVRVNNRRGGQCWPFKQCAVRLCTEESLLANIRHWRTNRATDGCTPSEALNALNWRRLRSRGKAR